MDYNLCKKRHNHNLILKSAEIHKRQNHRIMGNKLNVKDKCKKDDAQRKTAVSKNAPSIIKGNNKMLMTTDSGQLILNSKILHSTP